jgi:hypothetical protein
MRANEVVMGAHGVLCSPSEIYARHPRFMLAIQVLCSPSRFYARHPGFMLAIQVLCSPSRFYARHPGFMLAIQVLCSPSKISTHKTKNTAGATLQCSQHPLDEASTLKINHSLKHEISFLNFHFYWFQFPCHFIYNKIRIRF